ncbi:electron transport complex subunit RsxC [Buchnera aphidicola]|uniref:electron transport complex subunit RsxC n=1 Tax=Buchnera aphidicola TaxID=9 RepID=UPI003463CC0D
MNKLFQKYQFYGGLSIPSHKQNNIIFPLKNMPCPELIRIPVKNYLIRQNKLCISQGDHVSIGDPLIIGDNINPTMHASISGVIGMINIDYNDFYFDEKETEILIISDHDYDNKHHSVKIDYKKLKKSDIIKKICQFGIVGLGGSGFSCSKKLQTFVKSKYNILIVNAVECEPYVVADECLIQNYAGDVFLGCEIISWVLDIKTVIVAVSQNKLKTIEIIIQELVHFINFELRIIPEIYPSGSSKQLIKILLNQEIPHEKHANDMGILIHNVGTLFAIKRAVINNIPLFERIVTIAGNNVFDVENYWVKIGTPVSHILNCISMKSLHNNKIMLGGVFLNDDKPLKLDPIVLKTTNYILLFNKNNINDNFFKSNNSRECIRCAACSNVCPIRLLPQQLYWYSKNHDHDKSKLYNIKDCIECGLCERVCPSKIHLVSYYKKEKKIIDNIEKNKNRIKISKIRFQQHEKRLNLQKIFHKNSNFRMDNVINFNKIDFLKNQSNLIKHNNLIKKIDIKNQIKNSILRIKNKKNKFL